MKKRPPITMIDLDAPQEGVKRDPAWDVKLERLEGESMSDHLKRESLARDRYREDHREDDTYKPVRTAPRFTTQYAINWGQDQGWTLLDREHYNVFAKRHNDLLLASDAMFECPNGLVFVQGAGRGERAAHREKFEERGGVERCRKLKIRFVYVEFERGDFAPIRKEDWA